jgi:hypothetical protein
MRRYGVSVFLFGMVILLMPSIFIGDEKADQDGVKAFKQYVSGYMTSYETDKREQVVKLGGGWVKMRFEPVGVPNIDVRKTDSLISPYIGVCEFTLARHYTAFHPSREAAQADDQLVNGGETKHKHTYAFQDGHWVPTLRQNYDAFL